MIYSYYLRLALTDTDLGESIILTLVISLNRDIHINGERSNFCSCRSIAHDSTLSLNKRWTQSHCHIKTRGSSMRVDLKEKERSMAHDFDGRRDTNLVYRSARLGFLWDRNRPCTTARHGRCKLYLFLSYISLFFSRLFFSFFSLHPPVSCCPTGATNS